MNERCQDNVKVGMGILHGYRWIITKRGYANVVKSLDDDVWGIIYKISSKDEKELDMYEGVKKKCYTKENLEISIDGKNHNCWTYVDPITNEGIPTVTYIGTINEGLSDSKLPKEYVEKYLRSKIPS
jgi:gamma-glutamylcyclotransferase (GGCT)/AIG2-like uncharacterized protein YtfP